jgi:hypothetical protein
LKAFCVLVRVTNVREVEGMTRITKGQQAAMTGEDRGGRKVS